MAYEFRFPDVGEGIHEGTIVAWLVKVGDAVTVDQPFIKVETDKAVVDLPSPVPGSVLALHFQKGDTIHVGDVIATFGEAGEKASAPPVPRADSAEPESSKAIAAAEKNIPPAPPDRKSVV